ncbi:MAG: tRNA uridine-5-carboxymethylaminomethyl(34) synthesis GTPase MnmE [Methylobacterium sp.]|nr:tRNA uridine-5-carboxymethylaminomethyl(34) synthesis GTPase MnmE [Methylobacterium sp.]MCA3602760.1 tRNA uridine-5-carboxymethylaminomethyl(34) synthesis GTPase MnmE [Methylobacterium sp.]MCA3615682.1 tRNA uridine-5-carboxymethylaminomethyl(34) synthesis GTPase MnmE [Methylobacterium sp.]MCA4908798.1 tRNA uridine-5-carboxymethylaminomethyl(34) synthesis GTPase MnmE [Methylobacterium sp.]
MEAETIFALSSGAARSGVAVIRVSGPAAGEVLALFLDKPVRPREAALRAIRDPRDGSLIDRGLVLYFPAPHSFTGEDVVEFQVHGSLAVMRQLLARLGGVPGLRAARPGEFTRRAWLGGRMDLLEVEALSDTLAAETELQRKLALDGSRRLRAKTAEWRGALMRLRALVEAEIDFGDEGDVIDRLDSGAEREIRDVADALRRAAASLHIGQKVRTGFRVAILGEPNAGKSSLLNALADRDVAITSPRPGTTRDVVEAVVDLDGLPVIFMDTAGLRSSAEDELEAEGMRRSMRAGDVADLVIWASAIDSPTKPFDPRFLVVNTKGDLAQSDMDGSLVVSSRTGDGIDSLTKEIHRRAGMDRAGFDQGTEALVAHERHARSLLRAAEALDHAIGHGAIAMDMRAEELRVACDSLDGLIGRVSPDDVLGEIFSRFCIGK